MKKFITTWKIWQFIEAALLLTIGITTFVCAVSSNDYSVVGYVAGAVLIADGVLRAFVNIAVKDNTDISLAKEAAAIMELALGIWLCIMPEQLAEHVVLIASLACACAGTVYLIDAVVATIKKTVSTRILVMQYISSVVVIAIGVIALVFYPSYPGGNPNVTGSFNTIVLILSIFGIALAVLGVYEIIATIVLITKAKKLEKAVVDDVVAKHEEQREAEKSKRKSKSAKVVEAEVTKTVVEETVEEEKTEEKPTEEPKE